MGVVPNMKLFYHHVGLLGVPAAEWFFWGSCKRLSGPLIILFAPKEPEAVGDHSDSCGLLMDPRSYCHDTCSHVGMGSSMELFWHHVGLLRIPAAEGLLWGCCKRLSGPWMIFVESKGPEAVGDHWNSCGLIVNPWRYCRDRQSNRHTDQHWWAEARYLGTGTRTPVNTKANL